MRDAAGHETDILYLHSRCHVNSPTWAYLEAGGKQLVIVCAECEAFIARFLLREENETCPTNG